MHLRIIRKIRNLYNQKILGRRGHTAIIKENLVQLAASVSDPVIIETGCIRSMTEGTLSTHTISSTLKDKGTFYTFELVKEHIEICMSICSEYNDYITYVEGDSVVNLQKMVDEKALTHIDLAFFDSVNNGDHIWKEFSIVEGLFKKGAVVIVDDVLWADKGRVLKPYLDQSPVWETRTHNIENGILVAHKLTD